MINEYLSKFLYDNYVQNGETIVKYCFERQLHRESQTYSFYIVIIIEDSNGLLVNRRILLGTTPRNIS